MITPEYVRMMAGYNTWQNQSLYTAADTLDQAARDKDRGAFFGSIRRTLSHILWGDTIWMNRFAGWEAPEVSIQDSPEFVLDWAELKSERIFTDKRIEDWADQVSQEDLSGALSWHSGALGRDVTRPRAMLVVHLFNHQTHHRGQVHAMLTAEGVKPDDTDIPFREKH